MNQRSVMKANTGHSANTPPAHVLTFFTRNQSLPPEQFGLLHSFYTTKTLPSYFSQKHELCYNRPALKHPHAEHAFKPPAEPLERNTDTQELVIKSLPHSEREHILRTGVNQAA